MLLVACLASAGCTAPRMMALDPPPVVSSGDFEPGQRVMVVLRDGTRIKGRIAAATEDGLAIDPSASGRQRDVAFADMQQLKLRESSTARTVAAIGGALLAVVGVLYVIAVNQHKNDD